MLRRDFLKLSALSVLSASSSAFSAPDAKAVSGRKPNFIHILADDMGWGDIACFGHSKVKTPYLDKMAREGISFTNFYVNGPSCSPSRVGIVTGQFPASYRVWGGLSGNPEVNILNDMIDYLPTDAPNMMKIFNDNGYKIGHFGKWHLGHTPDAPPPSEYGIDQYRRRQDFGHSGGPVWTPQDWQHLRERVDGWDDDDWQPYSTELIIDEGVRFIEEFKDEPFCLNLWFTDPHAQLNPTLGQMEEYKEYNPDAPEGDNFKSAEAVYYSVITNMDKQIGRILNKIKRLGLDNDTIITFTSDNGPEYICIGIGEAAHSGVGTPGPFRGQKHTLYDGGIRTPLIVRWAGHTPKGIVDDTTLMAGSDLLPTMCEIAEIDLPQEITEKFDGIDVSQAWFGTPIEERKPVMWEIRGMANGDYSARSPALAIRWKQWKLLVNQDSSRLELYDILSDTLEVNNVADKYPDIASSLSQQLLAWSNSNPWTKAPLANVGQGPKEYPWPE
ncbi:Arylsulfatase precursor [Limihaloglobus sulfuriphilus]|uniref:Arylsulfatase n=1 Tax=Limihaloglobus sulfuriphilus TaxID=1851148 RepID=A0A1R7T5Z9_9BACT|nr:sulfatase-like hydrolase/transferase [Limihaloglobus sulfuriphilus]AQQ72063.1 Arylsulfatase precursor [Limihaloglobus sulfuriphilus]